MKKGETNNNVPESNTLRSSDTTNPNTWSPNTCSI